MKRFDLFVICLMESLILYDFVVLASVLGLGYLMYIMIGTIGKGE